MYNPEIYVACLASYNNAILHGAWIDATQSAEDIECEVQKMLSKSPESDSEEWAIHDHSDFGGVEISEWESFGNVSAIAVFLIDHGELGALVLEHCNGNLKDSEKMLENYIGEFKSLEDYAIEYCNDCMDIPESLEPYFDYERFGKDLSYDLIEIEKSFREIHLFYNF